MRRRQRTTLFVVLLLLPSTSFAVEPVSSSATRTPFSFDDHLKLDLEFNYSYEREVNLLDQVTMTKLPHGSLMVRYEGLHSFVMKHARSQSRRFVRQAVRKGWYVVTDDLLPRRATYEQVDHATPDPQMNGGWWERTWWESLPPEKGGAPAVPYVHTYGQETEWKLGPLTVTNTLKIKFDYFAFFEVNPDPVSHEHGQHSTPISVDVHPVHETEVGTHFRFKVKPRFRVGLPQHGDWLSVLKGVALRGSFEIRRLGKTLIEAEAEIKWRQRDGLVVTLEIALVSW